MNRAGRPLGAGKRAQVAGGVLALVLMASAGDAGAGGREDGATSAPQPTQQARTATPTTPTPTAKVGVGGGGTGGRIDRLDGALLAVADPGVPANPPTLTAAEVKRAALDREKTRRERAARLPARAVSAPKKE